MNTWEDNFRLILHNDSTILMLSIKHGFAVLHRKTTLGQGATKKTAEFLKMVPKSPVLSQHPCYFLHS